LECIELINKFNFSFTLSTNNKNQYEYPGIKLVYDISQNNPERILFYMHSKGMVFSNYKNTRSFDEMLWLRYSIKDYQKVIRIFKERKEINKIGITPYYDSNITINAVILCNFFWIKTNYLIDATPPIISDNRCYYEEYIGNCVNKKLHDCYSLLTNDNTEFVSNSVDFIKEKLKNSDEFKKLYEFFNLKNYTFYYGTDEDKTNITELVINNCLNNNKINIPSGDGKRAKIFGDPYPGVFKYIFIKKYFTETKYTDISYIYIDLINDIVYQVDDMPN
jgi:hypothetical protein